MADVHPKNKERADRAEAALLTYVELTNSQDDWSYDDKELVVSDLLTDLEHFCELHDLNFSGAIARGNEHYTTESRNPEA
jgi:hypothetical protein